MVAGFLLCQLSGLCSGISFPATPLSPFIREELEAEQPKCPGEIIQRPARLMGATYSDDDINKGDEHFVPCPLLAEIRKSIEAERLDRPDREKVATIVSTTDWYDNVDCSRYGSWCKYYGIDGKCKINGEATSKIKRCPADWNEALKKADPLAALYPDEKEIRKKVAEEIQEWGNEECLDHDTIVRKQTKTILGNDVVIVRRHECYSCWQSFIGINSGQDKEG